MVYTIAQHSDNHDHVIGRYQRLYDDFEEAKAEYLRLAREWFRRAVTAVDENNERPSWTKCPPRLVEISELKTIYPERDVVEDLLPFFQKFKSRKKSVADKYLKDIVSLDKHLEEAIENLASNNICGNPMINNER